MDTTTATKTNTCNKCSYWNSTESDKGECRRNAPQAISFKVDDNVKYTAKFPLTNASDWCGEFSAK